MRARISTVFECTDRQLWDKIIEPQSLQYVAAPLLRFEPLVAGELDGEWIVGKTYEVRLSALGFLPLGQHRIKIVAIDRTTNTIESQESGSLARGATRGRLQASSASIIKTIPRNLVVLR